MQAFVVSALGEMLDQTKAATCFWVLSLFGFLWFFLPPSRLAAPEIRARAALSPFC